MKKAISPNWLNLIQVNVSSMDDTLITRGGIIHVGWFVLLFLRSFKLISLLCDSCEALLQNNSTLPFNLYINKHIESLKVGENLQKILSPKKKNLKTLLDKPYLKNIYNKDYCHVLLKFMLCVKDMCEIYVNLCTKCHMLSVMSALQALPQHSNISVVNVHVVQCLEMFLFPYWMCLLCLACHLSGKKKSLLREYVSNLPPVLYLSRSLSCKKKYIKAITPEFNCVFHNHVYITAITIIN